MKNKKYIGIGAVLGVLMMIAGAAYHFYPDAVKNMFGVDSAVDTMAEIDPTGLDTSSNTSMMASEGSEAASDATHDASNGNNVAKGSAETAPTDAVDQDNDTDSTANDDGAPISDQAPPLAAENNIDSTIVPPPSSPPSLSSSCRFPNAAPSTTREIIFNEIAWMGSASSSNDEWMELKNNSAAAVGLSGWELLNASGKIKIVFSAGDAIPPGGLFLLSRASATNVANVASATGAAPTANTKIYSGDLVNGGDIIALMDPRCNASDYLDALNGWPGGNNTTKQTLERAADGIGWQTSTLPGGTPDAENSAGPPPVQYTLNVAFQGASPGSIVSDPAGLVCGASCTGSYASGTEITLTPGSGNNSVFNGWSGVCYGQTDCSFTMTGNISITADFKSTLALPTSSGDSDDGDIPSAVAPQATSTPPAPPGNVLISAVQIAGASSSNDFVRLYNPTAAAIDMSGWKLHKKSQTGTDYSLKEFPTGSVIAPGQSFIWANSAGGFSGAIGANVSSTETLSADNSVALMDASGNIVDAVAWGSGAAQYGEGPPYPTDPAAGQTLVRTSSNGVVTNTENNANDFTLQ